MRLLLASVVVLAACGEFVDPSGTGGGGGATGGGGGSTSKLRFTSVSGSYAGTMVSHQSPTWTDRVENRVELSGGSTSQALDFNVASFNTAFSGPSIDLRSVLIAGQKRVEDNDPNDVCAPLSVPVDGVPFSLKWVSVGDAVTITLDIFPATPFSCGYASYRMTPPNYPTATTTLTALQSGAPVSLRFVGGSTYMQGMNNINTEALTWDFTVGMQVGP